MCVACARSFQDAADLDAFCARHNASSLSNEDKPQRVVVDLEIATQEAKKRVDSATRKLYLSETMERRAKRLDVLVELETTTVAATDAERVTASQRHEESRSVSADACRARDEGGDIAKGKRSSKEN